MLSSHVSSVTVLSYPDDLQQKSAKTLRTEEVVFLPNSAHVDNGYSKHADV